MSISPPVGQLLRLVVQKAGHVPQAAEGRWEKSAMMRTSLYESFEVMRTDWRPLGATLVESEAMM